MDYAELWLRAEEWSTTLHRFRKGPRERVAVALPRCPDLVVLQLASWLAGYSFVPLDPTLPEARLGEIIEAATPVVTVTDDPARIRRIWPGPVLDSDPETAEDAGGGEGSARLGATDDAAVVVFTSGTTGTPKGVVLSHEGLGSYVDWYGSHHDVHAGEVAAAFASLGFDAAISDLWGPLSHGLTVALPSDEVVRDPEAIVDFVRRHNVAHAFLSTPMGELVLAQDRAVPSLRRLVVGGARLRVWPAADLTYSVVNIYGPTEATIATTATEDLRRHPDRGSGLLPPIGRPLPGLHIDLVDPSGEPVADGEDGELVVSGPQVALGYLDDPGLTARHFATGPKGRSYRTGDVCRRRASGELEFVARRDRQVKVRGYRVELGDLEHALMSCPGVDLAHVIATEGDLGADLHAWVQGPADIATVQRHLAETVPQYLQPRTLTTGTLPLSANGKVAEERLALPAERDDESRTAHASTSDGSVSDEVAAIWSEVLGVEVGPTSDFFRCGGDSIRATKVTQRVRARFAVDVPIATLLQQPALAEYVDEVTRLLHACGDGTSRSTCPSDHRPSFLQQNRLKRIAATVEAGRSPGAIWVPVVVEVDGPRDDAEIVRALASLAARHDALRTCFRPGPDGLPTTEVSDTAHLPTQVRRGPAAAVPGVVAELLEAPVDPVSGPLARAVVVRHDMTHCSIALAVEHLVTDAESMTVLASDLAAALENLPDLPAPLQQSEWVVRQHSRLSPERTDDILAFWRGVLPGGRPFPELILPTPSNHVDRAVDTRTIVVDRDSTEALERAARERGATTYTAVLASLVRALERSGLESPLVVHTPVANRLEPGSENTVGWLAHSVPVPVPSSSGLDRDVHLRAVRERVTEVLAHQEVPLPRLVELLTPEDHGRAVRPARLFLDYRVDVPMERTNGDVTVRVRPHEPPETSAEPGLSVIVRRSSDGLHIGVVSDPRVVDEHFVAAVVRRLDADLRSLADEGGQA